MTRKMPLMYRPAGPRNQAKCRDEDNCAHTVDGYLPVDYGVGSFGGLDWCSVTPVDSDDRTGR